MRSTLKPYFLGGCDEDLRRRTVRTSSKDLPQQTKKTALRLDGVQISLGYAKIAPSLSITPAAKRIPITTSKLPLTIFMTL